MSEHFFLCAVESSKMPLFPPTFYERGAETQMQLRAKVATGC